MVCSECGAVQAVMKTVVWIGEDEEYALCDPCYAEVADEVLVIPGMAYAFGWCRTCRGWHSVNELKEWAGGGPRGAPQGTCLGCLDGEETC